MYALNSIHIQAKRDEVLAILKKNRSEHAKIVQEARAGYCDKAMTELAKRLEKLKSGKITSLAFALKMPVDMTSTYDTAIKMLELHTEATIQLGGSEVRNFIEDKWDWSREFYVSNSAYSGTARAAVGTIEEDDG
jgi:hypothetical protein